MSNLPVSLQQAVDNNGAQVVLENLFEAFKKSIDQRDLMALLLEQKGVIVSDDCRIARTGSTDDQGNFHPLNYSKLDSEKRELILQQAEACHVGTPNRFKFSPEQFAHVLN